MVVGTRRGNKTTQPRAAKRQKVEEAYVPVGHSNILSTLPLEILLQIFSRLPLKSLLSLTCVNVSFRGILFDVSCNGIWRESRHNQPGKPPDPPQHFLEVHWAILLYGRNICQICASKREVLVNFYLLKRLCKACEESGKSCSDAPKKKQFHHLATLVLRDQHRADRCWEPEVHAIQNRLEDLYAALKNGNKTAQNELASYRAQRRELVASATLNWENYHSWFRNVNGEGIKMNNRQQFILNRFLELGYEASDIWSVIHHNLALRGGALTDRRFNSIRDVLESAVKQSQKDRERHAIFDTFPHIFKNVVHSHLETVSPSEWWQYPSSDDLYWIPEVHIVLRSYRYKESIVKCPPTLMELLPRLPSLITEWISELKIQLWRKIVAYAGPRSPLYRPKSQDLVSRWFTKSTAQMEQAMEVLPLAAAVFICSSLTCTSEPVAFSWEGCIRHRCSDSERRQRYSGKPSIDFYADGHNVVTSLMRLTDLDPIEATAKDLDELGLLFVCDVCSNEADHKDACFAYSWREAVHHRFIMPEVHAKFRPLSDEERSKIVYVQEDPRLTEPSWMCTHCTEHLRNLSNYDEALQHVKSVHGINAPTGGDIILGPGKNAWPYSRALLANSL